MATLPQAVARHVDAAGLTGARLVAAVSGGPDSLALLHALHCLRDSHRLSLCVAHVDHGLRATSALDAGFVRERAAALALPCTVVAVDVSRRPDGSFSEAAARDARYRALASVAVREGAAAIATGHTADDQAETVLLHAVRGAGLAGLRAMSVLLSNAPIDDGAGIRLFRPLLGVRRSKTQAYCRELGLTPLHDETNDDVRIPRNLLRLEAMPLLERLNPQAVSALARLADTAGGALDFMEAALDSEWPAMASASDGAVALDRERFRAMHPALQGLAVRRAHQQAVGANADIGRGARGGGAKAGKRPLGQGGRAAGRRPHGSAPRGAGVPPSGTRTALVAAIRGRASADRAGRLVDAGMARES